MSAPTLDYFLPLGFDSTYERIFAVYRKRWVAFCIIAAVMYVLGWVLAIFLSLVLGNDIRIDGFSSDYGYAYVFENVGQLLFYYVELAIYFVFACLAHGAAIWVTMHWYLNQSPHFYDAFVSAGQRWHPLVGATVLLALIAIVPMILPIITLWAIAGGVNANYGLVLVWSTVFAVAWSLFVAVVTLVTYAAIMVEGKGPWESIKRSYELTKGHWFYILGVLLVWGIAKVVLGLIIVSFTLSPRPVVLWIGRVLDTIVGIFLLSIAPVFEGVIYVSLRVQKEELSSVRLGEEIGIEQDSYITMVPATEPVETVPAVAVEDGAYSLSPDNDEEAPPAAEKPNTEEADAADAPVAGKEDKEAGVLA